VTAALILVIMAGNQTIVADRVLPDMISAEGRKGSGAGAGEGSARL
jgi:hypothetical protein